MPSAGSDQDEPDPQMLMFSTKPADLTARSQRHALTFMTANAATEHTHVRMCRTRRANTRGWNLGSSN